MRLNHENHVDAEIQEEAKAFCRDCEVMPGEDGVTLCSFHAATVEVIERLDAACSLIEDLRNGWPSKELFTDPAKWIKETRRLTGRLG